MDSGTYVEPNIFFCSRENDVITLGAGFKSEHLPYRVKHNRGKVTNRCLSYENFAL